MVNLTGNQQPVGMELEDKKTNDFTLIWPAKNELQVTQTVDLADMTYEAFEEHLFKTGLSDTEYQKYLMGRKQDELVDFTNESIKEAILVYKYGDRIIKFKVIEDSDDI